MMSWEKLLTKTRLCAGTEGFSEKGRSGFQKDRDRLMFSPAFRRLQGKTQVHPLPQNDHVHNRLSHSLEVSSIARTLGMRIGEELSSRDLLPAENNPSEVSQICEAAALAHDIGNPPYGHACEGAISAWITRNIDEKIESDSPIGRIYASMSKQKIDDLKFFDGNAQGFRLLTQIELNFFDGGMRLSFPTLASFLKYPWIPFFGPKEEKSSCFISEKSILNTVADQVGLIELGENYFSRHPLVYIVEAADDICYRIIDIEDSIEMGVVEFREYEDLLSSIDPAIKGSYSQLKPGQARRKFFEMRGRVFDALMDATTESFFKNYENIMSGSPVSDLIQLNEGDPSELLRQCSQLAREKIFAEKKKVMVEIGVYENVNIVLGAFVGAVEEYILSKTNGKRMTPLAEKVVEHVEAEGFRMPDTLFECVRGVVDYYSGMTDRYANYVARRVAGISVD